MSRPVLESFEPLFATPLLQFSVPDFEALNAELVDEIAAIRAKSAGLSRSNQQAWHSDVDFFHRPEPACSSLRGHVINALRQATLRVAPEFEFSSKILQAEGWMNITGPGGYNVPHDHPGYAWSGSYYVRLPEGSGRSGAIEFLDSRTNVGLATIAGASCFFGKFTLKPKPGWILVFPSYVRHWVYPNEQQEDRISVAFNARFLPRPASAPEQGQ